MNNNSAGGWLVGRQTQFDHLAKLERKKALFIVLCVCALFFVLMLMIIIENYRAQKPNRILLYVYRR